MRGNTNATQSITVDNVLSTTSTNPVQNKTITTAVNGKQATLVSGTNIQTINGNNILTSGNLTVGDVTTSNMQDYVAQQIAQIDIPTATSDLTNDSGFITASQAPVQSVNGETGAVVLDIPTITAMTPTEFDTAWESA